MPFTTKYEIWAWYFYEFVTVAFFYSALNFIPILITSQARDMAKENYCLMTNRTIDCNGWAKDYENIGQCSMGDYNDNTSCLHKGGEWTAEISNEASQVVFLGVEQGYASVVQISITISIILQIIFFILLGGLGDFGNNRKNLLILFNTMGSICVCIIFFFKDYSLFYLNALLYIVSNVCFGMAIVFYNAYLPIFVLNCDDIVAPNVEKKRRIKSNELSSNGMSYGFFGILVIMGINIGVTLTQDDDEYYNTRLNILICGLWTLLLPMVTYFYLKTHVGKETNGSKCLIGLNQIISVGREIKNYSQLFLFLGAYFVYSDGFSTIGGAGIQFALVELNMTIESILVGLSVVPICSIIGCAIFKHLTTNTSMSSKTVLMICIPLGMIGPIYSITALTTPIEFYIMAAFLGFIGGPVQAFSRSIFSNCIPNGQESEFFSLYEITDRGTAWLGPLIVSIVYNSTGSFRIAFLSLFPFFLIGTIVLYFFNPELALREKNSIEAR